jgi:TonB family protein
VIDAEIPMHSNVLRTTLVLLLAMPTASRAVDAPANGPAWLTMDVQREDAAQIAAQYQALLLQSLPQTTVADPLALAAFKASDAWRFEREEFLGDPVGQGFLRWHFRARSGDRWPSAATVVSVPDPAVYQVHVRILCTSDASCRELEASVRAMPSPSPRVIGGGAEAQRQWLDLVTHEACDAAAPSMPPPAYPAAALREGAQGKATVHVVFNPCGEVRDASIAISSHNRDLDRAAMATVARWRIDPPPDLKARHVGADAIVPVDFRLDPPPAPSAPVAADPSGAAP